MTYLDNHKKAKALNLFYFAAEFKDKMRSAGKEKLKVRCSTKSITLLTIIIVVIVVLEPSVEDFFAGKDVAAEKKPDVDSEENFIA